MKWLDMIGVNIDGYDKHRGAAAQGDKVIK